ncbi:MAG TPA: VacB/RNase II family 3'-5' exoribonuclease [Acidobacteriaceae bacterium]|nr:VacB/RNase II family 3'-5' exoribonuclease [Acidobacteriaceae bacterium]
MPAPKRHPTSHERSDKDLLRRIERAPGHRAGYKQLVTEFGLGGGRERRLLLEQLARLTARGALTKLDREVWTIGAAENSTDKRARSGAPPSQWDQTRENLTAGKLDLHRDGYGFVRPDRSQKTEALKGQVDKDIFIPPNELNGAMQGDQVLVEVGPPGRDGRLSGRIARIMTRKNPTMVGVFHYASHDREARGGITLRRGNYVTPLDERISQPILIPDGMEIVPATLTPHRVLGEEALAQEVHGDNLEGLAVDVEITHWPTVTQPARGRVIEVLGDQNAFGVDVEIIIRKHHLPHLFPDNVLADAREAATHTVATLTPEQLKYRRDFRDLPIVTIDGETARDFDDAVLVRDLPNGNQQLQVHIADVAHYVTPGTALDLEARLRGNSVYFPDRAIPMLPQELSTDICSLRPHEDRLVMSCLMEIDPRGEVLSYEICEGIIRSAQRMTYTQVQAILDKDPAVSEQFMPLVPEFQRMEKLSLLLNHKRRRRGSIDFDLPEPVINFDPRGNMESIVRSERKWANRLIEEFMLSANECVSTWIEHQGVASIFRIHETPDPKRIVEFEDMAAGFGYTLGLSSLPVKKLVTKGDRRNAQSSGRKPQQTEIVGAIPVTPRMYQKLTAKIAGKPEERILSFMMLRSLKQARYSEQNEGHFALAAASYTHFTSPIRRYPDLIVHRLLKSLLHEGANPRGGAIFSDAPQPWGEKTGKNPGAPSIASSAMGGTSSRTRRPDADNAAIDPIPESELAAIALESSQAERRAEEAERELIEWKKIKFMQDRVGEDFDAMVLSVTKFGFFVELDDLFIEGLVPLSSLTDDIYTFRETTRQICGSRYGRCYTMGQRVHVLLDRVDRQQKRLQFAVLPSPEDLPPRKGKTRESKPDRPALSPKRSGKKKSRHRNQKAKGKRR